MKPCDAVYQDPTQVYREPVRACTPGTVTATVAARGPALPIDHIALSVGRPDGLYVAGKQLRPWLTFEERMALTHWDARSAERHTTTDRLTAMAQQESLLIRWRVENGFPGTAGVLTTTIGEGADQIEHAAFTWGEQRHSHVHKLGYDLIEMARGEMRQAKTSPAEIPRESYQRVHALVATLTSEFVLPIGDVCRILADVNLERATASLTEAQRVATFWGAV